MVACMGFGSLFHQAGILAPNNSSASDSPITSLLSAISTTSGASWYSTQLFYSEIFYEATALSSSSNELYDFVGLWLDSYRNLSASASMSAVANETCQELPVDDNTKSMCSIAVEYGGDWAAFINDMLRQASVAFGDADFSSRMATAEDRIAPLQETDLIVQTALTPNSRVLSSDAVGTTQNDTYVYIGPENETSVYTTPIPTAFVVTSSNTPAKGWWYGQREIPMAAYSAPGPNSSTFDFSDWQDFYLYPGDDGKAQIDLNTLPYSFQNKQLRVPFVTSGGTSVIQAAATGSALLGSFSGIVPSVFSQTMSVERYVIETSENDTLAERTVKLRAFDGAFTNRLYTNALAYNFAVCSQWPQPCGDTDSYFLDGLAADATALSTTIGNYQASPEADLSKTIKVLLSNTNENWDSIGNLQQILFHYSTTFNQDVAPGGFLWLKEYNKQPILSPQIFDAYMDTDTLNSLIEPIEGSNMTTALLKGTTIDNTAFSVVAGQSVEVLLINVNAPIPTLIVSPTMINEVKGPMGDMAVEIATNPELLSRVESFLALGDEDMPADGEDGEPATSLASTTVPVLFTFISCMITVMSALL